MSITQTPTRQSVAYRNLRKVAAPVAIVDTKAVEADKAIKREIARDADANKRTRDHIIWLVISLVLTSVLTFIPSDFFLHFGPIFGGAPLVITELQNWIHRW